MKKKIAILGSTGSIGKSFLSVVKKDNKNIEIVSFNCLNSIEFNINSPFDNLREKLKNDNSFGFFVENDRKNFSYKFLLHGIQVLLLQNLGRKLH